LCQLIQRVVIEGDQFAHASVCSCAAVAFTQLPSMAMVPSGNGPFVQPLGHKGDFR
jgi:hypothetical protein